LLFCILSWSLFCKEKIKTEFEAVFEKNLAKAVTIKELDKLYCCDAVVKEVYCHFLYLFQ